MSPNARTETPIGTRTAASDVDWASLHREVPAWFRGAGLGIFVHWGAYAVPAWAEPTGELGAVDDTTWFAHNPYAEWYANTTRLDGPAREHHREVFGGAPYDDLLDAWRAESFDPADWLDLFARAGARYVVPTTKHHDGIALWDAPGTGARNTVHRGPRRDLVAELAAATRAAGLRFGVYYSGGLDWAVTDLPPIASGPEVTGLRPVDAAYAAYAALHVRDLVDRYSPDVLWNDIEWPDAGKRAGSLGLLELFEHYYATVPEGVVNDRWGDTHFDYRTSEYQHGLANETGDAWENCRGIGLSFGHNQVEDASHVLDGPAVVRHLVDVVSRGGNLLLNVGPAADGTIPELQRRTLEQLAGWMAVNAGAVHDAFPLPAPPAAPGDAPWARWTVGPTGTWLVVAEPGHLELAAPQGLDPAGARLGDGTPVAARLEGDRLVLEVPAAGQPAPPAVCFPA
jgi:alpha-L-fucosidase